MWESSPEIQEKERKIVVFVFVSVLSNEFSRFFLVLQKWLFCSSVTQLRCSFLFQLNNPFSPPISWKFYQVTESAKKLMKTNKVKLKPQNRKMEEWTKNSSCSFKWIFKVFSCSSKMVKLLSLFLFLFYSLITWLCYFLIFFVLTWSSKFLKIGLKVVESAKKFMKTKIKSRKKSLKCALMTTNWGIICWNSRKWKN